MEQALTEDDYNALSNKLKKEEGILFLFLEDEEE